MRHGHRLTRPVIVTELRNGAEIGARRVPVGAELVVTRRWERGGRAYCRGVALQAGRSMEFVAPLWHVEEAMR